MLFEVDSEKAPWSAARKYGLCDVRSVVWMWKGVSFAPTKTMLVFVRSEALALQPG
jgi:hypothetical protein